MISNLLVSIDLIHTSYLPIHRERIHEGKHRG